MSVSVILAFFQPVNFDLPRRHFHAVVQTLHSQGVPLAVAQAVLPGQEPQPVPSCIPHLALPTNSLIFHKESLWNIAARRLTDAEKLIFIDADLVFSDTGWLSRCCEALDKFDVIQTFSEAKWLDRDGMVDMVRPPTSSAIHAEVNPSLVAYHPGFGWGMTRTAFEKTGGFYDLSVAGNADVFFAMALRETLPHSRLLSWFGKKQDKTALCESYKTYRRRAASLNLSVGTPQDVTVTHLWHGERQHRQYQRRGNLFPRRESGEYAAHVADSGLLEWDEIEISNDLARPYFLGRRDDG